MLAMGALTELRLSLTLPENIHKHTYIQLRILLCTCNYKSYTWIEKGISDKSKSLDFLSNEDFNISVQLQSHWSFSIPSCHSNPVNENLLALLKPYTLIHYQYVFLVVSFDNWAIFLSYFMLICAVHPTKHMPFSISWKL